MIAPQYLIPTRPFLMILTIAGSVLVGPAYAASASFDCRKAENGSIEDMICKDPKLSALDKKLAAVYTAASKQAVNEHPPVLKTEQRGWIKGRNDCRRADDKTRCVTDSYRRRIAELQARYRLVQGKGPVRYRCNGQSTHEVIATFFATDPPTAVAKYGDQVSTMYLEPAASGAKYAGNNVTLWEHHGEALITWGRGKPEMRCKPKP